MVGKLRREKAGDSPPSGKPRRRRAIARLKVGGDVTGQTVFHDRPLNFRSLTVTEVDIPTLQSQTAIEGGAFKIRVARRGSRRDATTLVREKYAARGYATPFVAEKPRVFTFVAYDEGRVVGTVSVGMDSSEGLFADGLYREEIDRLRSAGSIVCEFTRLAVDRNAASKRVLAGLFHTAYLFACKIRGCSHAVIEVNPRHVVFYGNELRFEVLGQERMDPRVNAPAVLLSVSFAAIGEGIGKSAGKHVPSGTKRTLFHYGFPPKEEQGVLERLTELVAERNGWGP
jgi:N-acyl amino acid synthase FeeM